MQTVGSAARGSHLSSRSLPRCWPSGWHPRPDRAGGRVGLGALGRGSGSGDGGLATQAQLDLPSDVAVYGWNLPKDRGRTYQGECVLQRSMSQMLTRTRYLKTVDENGRQSPTCLKGRDACTHAYRIESDA